LLKKTTSNGLSRTSAVLTRSRTDVGLTVGFERVEGIRAARTAVNAGDCAHLDTVDAPRIVIYAGEVGARVAPIDPERQAAVVGAGGSGSAPVHLNKMRCVANCDPAAARPAVAVIAQRSPQLIAALRKTKLNAQNRRRGGTVAEENVMGIVTRHPDRIGVEIKANAITSLGVRRIIGNVDRIVIVNHSLQTVIPDQRRAGIYIQIAGIWQAG
jgi:hypothetical protein